MKKQFGIEFKEDGKSWYIYSDNIKSLCKSIFRQHDENFSGMRFEHKRCPFCNRITSIHTLHWLNHLNKCAPKKYALDDLMKLQHRTPKEYDKINNDQFLARK